MSHQLPHTCLYRGRPKLVFATEEAARDFAASNGQTPYQCSNCRQWHLTSGSPTRSLDRRIKKLVGRQNKKPNKKQRGA